MVNRVRKYRNLKGAPASVSEDEDIQALEREAKADLSKAVDKVLDGKGKGRAPTWGGKTDKLSAKERSGDVDVAEGHFIWHGRKIPKSREIEFHRAMRYVRDENGFFSGPINVKRENKIIHAFITQFLASPVGHFDRDGKKASEGKARFLMNRNDDGPLDFNGRTIPADMRDEFGKALAKFKIFLSKQRLNVGQEMELLDGFVDRFLAGDYSEKGGKDAPEPVGTAPSAFDSAHEAPVDMDGGESPEEAKEIDATSELRPLDAVAKASSTSMGKAFKESFSGEIQGHSGGVVKDVGKTPVHMEAGEQVLTDKQQQDLFPDDDTGSIRGSYLAMFGQPVVKDDVVSTHVDDVVKDDVVSTHVDDVVKDDVVSTHVDDVVKDDVVSTHVDDVVKDDVVSTHVDDVVKDDVVSTHVDDVVKDDVVSTHVDDVVKDDVVSTHVDDVVKDDVDECSGVKECGKPVRAKGLCHTCYWRRSSRRRRAKDKGQAPSPVKTAKPVQDKVQDKDMDSRMTALEQKHDEMASMFQGGMQQMMEMLKEIKSQ